MDLSQPPRQAGIDAGYKGNSSAPGHPSGRTSGDGQAEQQGKRRPDPAHAQPLRQVTDGLDYSGKDVDVQPAHREQKNEGGGDIESARNESAPDDRARKNASGFLDFVAHHRSQL